MSDDFDIPQTRLDATAVEALCGFKPPREARFSLASYEPAGPVCAAYIRSQGPIDGITGPGGSGKTVGSIVKAIRFSVATMPVCLDGRIRVRGACVRDNLRSLYRTTLQSWFNFFPLSKYPDFFGGQDRPAKHILKLATIRDGVEIPVDLTVEFFGIADTNYELIFKSYEVSWAWATEADGVPAPAVPFFFSRTARYPPQEMLGKQKRPRMMMVDFNPPDPDHPLWHAMTRGSFREDFNPDVDTRTVNFYQQPSGLAPDAENRKGKSREEYLAEDQTMPKDDSRRMVHGRPGRVKDGLPVYDEEWDDDVFVSQTPLEILPGLPLHAGFDQDLTPAAVFFQETPDGQIRMLREVYLGHGVGVDRFLEAILPLLHGPLRGLPPGVAAADPAGFYGKDRNYGQLAWADAMSQGLGWRIVPAPTNEWDMRRAALSLVMRTTRRAGRDFPHLLIDPACKQLRKGLASGFKYGKRHDGTFDPRPSKNEYSHVCEAAQYGVLAVRGVAGMVATIAAADRPRLIQPDRPFVAGSNWSGFGS